MRIIRLTWVFLLFCAALTVPAHAQEERLARGRVLDVQTSEPLPAANIRILGTNRGTITNREGAWLLRVPEGEVVLVFSFVGYAPDTLRTSGAGEIFYEARLTPVVLERETLIVSGNDPARAIIRKAIDAKAHQREGLESYRFEAFTRRAIIREDSIAGITEGYSVGWWKKGKPLREQITQRRETENLPDVQGLQGVLSIEDFSQDDLELTGDNYVGPLHPDAFRWYDYDLIGQRMLGEIPIYEIRMTPRTVLIPLLRGTLQIADGSWALVGVDLEPDQPLNIPFVRDFQIHWQQSFTLRGGKYWLPSDIRMQGGLKVAIGPIRIPRIGFDQTAIIYDYELNVDVPDSLYQRESIAVEMPGAAVVDSSFWASHEVLPLTSEEQRAYAGLDSTKTLEEQFAPEGFGMRLDEDSLSFGASVSSEAIGGVLSHFTGGYNRVDGSQYGFHAEVDSLLSDRLQVGGMGRWGVSGERWLWEMSLTMHGRSRSPLFAWFPGGRHRVTLRLFDRTSSPVTAGFYPEFINSFSALLGKVDYYDYYRAHGWRLEFRDNSSERGGTLISFGVERIQSLAVTTGYSLVDREAPFRTNPPVDEGLWSQTVLQKRFRQPESVAGVTTGNGLLLRYESGVPTSGGYRLGSSGDAGRYQRVDGVWSLRFNTWTSRFIFSPYLTVRLAGSWSDGTLPVFARTAPESALGFYSPLGALKALKPRELVGDRWWSVTAEHNFRNIPFRAVGLDGLANRGLEILFHGGLARSRRGGLDLPAAGPYAEAGFGIGRIWDILRLDVTRRLVEPVGWQVTVALTTFL